ncbi:MAG: AMP-binding protein [Alistipes sp.]|nr:AMP-binding protein [Alistipes sp.]
MKHYLNRLQESMVAKWNTEALSDYQGETFTFANFATEISRLHTIFNIVGVESGEKISLAAKNSSRWAMAFLATTTYRAVAVPILCDFTFDAITNLVAHSDSKILFTEPRIWENIDIEEMPQLQAVISLEDYSVLYLRNEEKRALINESLDKIPSVYPESAKHEVVNYGEFSLDDLAIINYTSGTTSQPKGVMLTSRNISANIDFALDNIAVEEGDKIISMLPLAHMYGMAFEFIYPICGGGHVYFLGKTPTPTLLMKALAEVKPYLLITVPLVIEKIFKGKVMPVLEKPLMRCLTKLPLLNSVIYGKVRKQLLTTFGGNLRSIVLGGAALNPTVERIMRRVKLPYTVGYGMTECAPLLSYAPWQTFVPGSCGRAVDGLELRIDSTDPQKIVGEIQAHGPNVMIGYYKNEEATKAVFTEEGFLRTGDLGIIDKQGNVFIKGRSKCMILTANGQNIYPEEIEAHLNSMPHIAESLVVERNKALVALVALPVDDQELSDGEVAEFMEQTRKELNLILPTYSQISKIEVLREGFVHTPKHSIKRFLYN